MPTADNSHTARTNALRSKTLAVFHRLNPNVRELQNSQYSQDELLAQHVGAIPLVVQPPTNPRYMTDACCCTDLGAITGFTAPIYPNYGEPNGIGIQYDNIWLISWNPVANATSYTITCNSLYPYVVSYPSTTSAILRITYPDDRTSEDFFNITLTLSNSCSSSIINSQAAPCFLKGSLITMADGSSKPIEEVEVGDKLLGAFGEINTVLALHRPLLGTAQMAKINNEHSTSSHHPHISTDKQFYCAHPARVDNQTYGREHDVIDGSGNVVKRMLHGLKKGRTQLMTLGLNLKTVEGSRILETLEIYDLPPETQLYNLVVDGSHTYYVEGYAVTGWPREDDFDYENWVAK